jgi:ABC-type glycerol-3-phosphate transport system substrate-binding protein
MLRRLCAAALVVLLVPALTGCGFRELTRDRLLVWHDWPEAEAAILTELLRGYGEVDPDLELIIEYVPADEIEQRFVDEVRSGFGPDVFIGADAAALSAIVDEGAVHGISPAQAERYGFDELDDRAMASMAVDDSQRGVPLAAFTDVMYVRHGVTAPADLDQIIELADEGQSIAIPLDFFDIFWGIDAFEGTVFGDGDDVEPDEGFVRWMEWLVEARRHPNVILDPDYEMLRDLFADGKIDVFFGGSRELGTFRSTLRIADEDATANESDGAGEDESTTDGSDIKASTPTLTNIGDFMFGLRTLPGVDDETPGGFLDVEGMVLNRHTDNLNNSLALMEYLTNVPSQGRIARAGVGRIPINPSVSIDPTISPMEAALVVQQRHANVLPRQFQHRQPELRAVANDVYLQVTRGLLEPEDAALRLRELYEEATEATDE